MIENILLKDSAIERVDRIEVDFKLHEKYPSPHSATWTNSSAAPPTSNC